MDKKLKLTSKVIDKLIIEKMDYFTHSINLLCEYRENCISCPLQRNTQECYYYLFRSIVLKNIDNEIITDMEILEAKEAEAFDEYKNRN